MSELPTEARSVFWGILVHSLRRDVLKATALEWATEETFAFSKDHTEKSTGFKLGDAGGHISSLQNIGKWLTKIWQNIGTPCCWKVKGWYLWIFFYPFKRWNQNIINVEVCVDLYLLFHENQRRLPRVSDCSPHHEWKRLLSVVDCSHGLTNDCWNFFLHSVILIVNRNINCDEFSIRKNGFSLCCTSLQIFKRNCWYMINTV